METELRALVVDQFPGAPGSLGERLGQAGFEIVYAEDCLQGLRVFARDRPRLIAINRQIPGLDGIRFVRRIREGSNVPVIMFTDSMSAPDVEEAAHVGVDRYLQTDDDLDRVGAVAIELVGCTDAERSHTRKCARMKRLDGVTAGAIPGLSSRTMTVAMSKTVTGTMTAMEARELGRRELRDELERQLIECRGNIAEMARRMGKDRSTIRYHLRRLEMLDPDERPNKEKPARNSHPSGLL